MAAIDRTSLTTPCESGSDVSSGRLLLDRDSSINVFRAILNTHAANWISLPSKVSSLVNTSRKASLTMPSGSMAPRYETNSRRVDSSTRAAERRHDRYRDGQTQGSDRNHRRPSHKAQTSTKATSLHSPLSVEISTRLLQPAPPVCMRYRRAQPRSAKRVTCAGGLRRQH